MLKNPSFALAYLLFTIYLIEPSWGQASTQTVHIGGTQFTIPTDMQLQAVAGEDLTTWPILADWDLRGRLLLVESGGVSHPIVESNKQLLHRIVRLDDHDGDGHFDERTIVAAGLPFTEGILCIGRDLLVTAPPAIYRLIDADQDGLYEDREVWFDGQTITGCANDLHGPYMGRDGWIYWCKGGFGEQQQTSLDGKQFTTKASYIFRRRLSGGPIEPVMTGGMDNPVEVASTPEGERFFTSTFLHTPGQIPGLRDGIAHAVYGGLYGKDYPKAIEGHVRTGELMPALVELGAAAPSGLACLASTQLLPPELAGQRTLVAALFNLQKVTAHRLRPAGASFTTDTRDLVIADRIDFHPTDVLEDADGSLLIVDTGGWYDLCCPSSRIDQKTAAGGIYRLSRIASSDAGQPVLTRETNGAAETAATIDPAIIVQHLIDARPWVARRAQLQLLDLANPADGSTEEGQASSDIDATATKLLPRSSGSRVDLRLATEIIATTTSSLEQQMSDSSLELNKRLTCLWGLCTIGNPRALAAISQQLSGPHDSLVQAAGHAVSLHRYAAAKPQLEHLLQHTNLQVRRVAAEGLGRIGDSISARKLLASLDTNAPYDRHWQHSATYALIELSAVDEALECLSPESLQANTQPKSATVIPSAATGSNPLRKQVALLAIDQLAATDQLTVNMLLDGLQSNDEHYRETASQILAKHPQWAPDYRAAIGELFQHASEASRPARTASLDANAPLKGTLQTIVAGWRDTRTVQELMSAWINASPTLDQIKQQQLIILLTAFDRAELPPSWIEPLVNWLEKAEPTTRLSIASQLSNLKLPMSSALSAKLLSLAATSQNDVARLQFLAALPIGSVLASPQLETSILSALAEDEKDQEVDSAEVDLESPSATTGNSAPTATLSSAGLAALQRVRLSPQAGRQLLATLPQQPTRFLPLVVDAISRVGDDALDTELLSQLSGLPAARTLTEEQLLNLYRSRPKGLQQAAQATVASLSRPPTDIQEKIDTVLTQLKPGDPIRGLQLFRSSKVSCSGCHRLGYVGGEIGPNLTHIGTSRTRPALLEAILFPNARLEQSFQPTKVLTHDGQVFNGLITRHISPTQFVMQLSADKSIVLSTDDIARQEASQVSIMPGGLAELLTLDELSDLLAILESAK